MLSKLCRHWLGDTLEGIVTVQITSQAGADNDESNDEVLLNSSADKPKEQTDVKEVTKLSREKKQEVRATHLRLRRNQSNTSVAGTAQTSGRQTREGCVRQR